jgi:serine/threonine protein kinase
LRGNRYRLLELQERQDWLSGVFEAVWLGQDAHRNGAQVHICEVALPETNSIMTQTLLRTATMTLVSVGRHRHIPALWDAFSDMGRSFFVFEPVDGESIYARLRYTGRPMSEQEVVECCLQMIEALELLSQQSPTLVHGLIRPEHILVGRNGSQYYLTRFSVVLAGGGTQYVAGMERSHLSAYAAPEFVRGVVDTRSDIYSLIATAYYAVTGSTPSGIGGSIPQAQRINPAISAEFDAILTKGLRSIAGQRYQRPSELRQDLLALRSVSGTLVPGGIERSMAAGGQAAYRRDAQAYGINSRAPVEKAAQQQELMLPFDLAGDIQEDERVDLLPKPEDLPPMPARNDRMNAVVMLSLVMIALIVLVVLSQTLT